MDAYITWIIDDSKDNEQTQLNQHKQVDLTNNIGELIKCSPDYISGYDTATVVDSNMIVIDGGYSQDFIAGFKARKPDIRILEITNSGETRGLSINISDYPKLYGDRNFKLDMIRLTAGFKVTILGDPRIDYQCSNTYILVNPSLNQIHLDHATLTHFISGTIIVKGERSDRVCNIYESGDYTTLIEQRQAFMIRNSDECCRIWFEAFMPEV